MKSANLIKNDERPEILFSVGVDENGKACAEDYVLVFPKHASANLPRYKKGHEIERGESKAKFRFMVKE
ncbi:hypothetical protein V7O66_12140 [Methanolobus sp. ZRKC3]|uniref:hypothetical protein n=1 Tax=Methanolobus sp. ZRKC3 TaxID=3125786 RepID=UPI0032568657